MDTRPSRRSGLILTLFICSAGLSPALAGPVGAAAPGKSDTAPVIVPSQNQAQQGSRQPKRDADHKSNSGALQSPADKITGAAASDLSPVIPPSVANANAELQKGDTPVGNAAKAMSARASSILKAAMDKPAGAQLSAAAQVVSADQLNDVDLALHEAAGAKTSLAMAVADAPAPPAAAVAVAAQGSGSSAWDQTSIIGKIFIGFGAVLTLASAARMFMA